MYSATWPVKRAAPILGIGLSRMRAYRGLWEKLLAPLTPLTLVGVRGVRGVRCFFVEYLLCARASSRVIFFVGMGCVTIASQVIGITSHSIPITSHSIPITSHVMAVTSQIILAQCRTVKKWGNIWRKANKVVSLHPIWNTCITFFPPIVCAH